MSGLIVLVWVAFICISAVILAGISIVQLVQNRQIRFDQGFLLSLSACFIALLLCLSIGPALHRVYDDELTYVSQSVNIVYFGKASVTIKGSRLHPEVFNAWTFNPKLPGFAFLESVVFFLTRDYEHSYFILNMVLGLLSVAAVYRITWLWTASHAMAWWAAVFLACLPVHITYSMSASSDIAGSFFFLLFLLFLSEYRVLRSRQVFYAALFCGVFSICIKQFCSIPVFLGLAIALYLYRREGILDKKMHSQVLMDIFCLFLPVLCSIPVFLFSDSMKGGYSAAYVFKNLCISGSYFFDPKQSTVLTAWAASGAIVMSIIYKRDKIVSWFTGWLLIGILLNSVFYAGGFSFPGVAYSDRYFMPLVFPFVFLAAKGMVEFLSWVRFRFISVFFIIILTVNACFASNHLTDKAIEGLYYEKTILLKRLAPYIPDDAYIIDNGAVLVTMTSPKRSILTDIFLNGDHPGKVVFLKEDYGVPDYDEMKNVVLVNNVLKTSYHCAPLIKSPVADEDLSITPILCARIK